jgi:hypothetical protein
MHTKIKIIIAACLCFILSGCFPPKSFVDPTVPKLSYDNLKKRQDQLRLKVIAEFQRNGEAFPRLNVSLKDNTERILRGTGVIAPVGDNAAGAGTIEVTVNNLGDIGAAAAKGAGVGLTFGLVGATVTDNYELTVRVNINGKTFTRKSIRHAIHTTIGNARIPPGMEAIPPNVAFERVLEQMLLKAIFDMQQSGELAMMPLRIGAVPYAMNQFSSLSR